MAGMEFVLNRDGVRFVELVDDLGLDGLKTRYTFSDEEEYRELLLRDLSEGMRGLLDRNLAKGASCRRNSHIEKQALAFRRGARCV